MNTVPSVMIASVAAAECLVAGAPAALAQSAATKPAQQCVAELKTFDA